MSYARRFAGALAALTAGCGAPAPPEAAPSFAVTRAAPAAPSEPVAFAVNRAQLTQGGWLGGTATGGIATLTLDGKPVPVGPDGRFFVAFDRDAGTRATLAARLADGRSETVTLPIAPRAWEIEHVDVAPRPAIPSEAFRRIRAGELARIAAARAKQTGAQGWRQDFVWPARGRISGRFGSQRIYRGEPGSYHSGIDIATGGSGAAFVAPADGVVILAATSPFTLEGKLLMIDHGAGLNSAFLHCSELLVREGEAVRQGQVIGRIGATGRATGPHLHWSLKWREARLDPILFTGPMG
ncbi:MAG: M23 family metallopeptidase [Novosphingobium sp.]|nr:M23 family metallopeptidase [Novosphingobium sp.]